MKRSRLRAPETPQNVIIVDEKICDTDWLTVREQWIGFPIKFFFRKPKKQKDIISTQARGFSTRWVWKCHSFFNEFKILLNLIFKIHSPGEIFLDWMNYTHTLLNFRRRRWVINFVPLKNSVTIMTSTWFFIHLY